MSQRTIGQQQWPVKLVHIHIISVHVCLSYTGVGLNVRKFSLKQRKPFILKFVLRSNLHLKGKFCNSVQKRQSENL